MRQLLLSLTFVCCGNINAQTLLINEIMQSNIDCVMDDLNEFPDSWVELYNPTSSTISLYGYKIGIKDKASKAWELPNKTIEPNEFILIYCDKEGSDMHTDFRLESGKGCNVYLFKGNEIVDQIVDLKKQPAPNIAYGRKKDGADEWGYQATPTPNATNCGKLCKKILDEPVFSQKGFVTENGNSFNLTLSLPEGSPDGTVIRYTLDGSEPTSSSDTYTEALTIKKTSIVRAKLFCDGYLSPRSTCHSYIFFDRYVTLPIISIMTDNRYLNDSKIGIYVDGSYQAGKKNYEFDWRRPINFEYFENTDEESQLNQLCETRIAGGATRSNKKKTLAVYANKRFGTKRLEYEFFPDQKPGLTDFKSIMLRNAGNDFDYLYMRDAIIQRTMASHVDLDWQAWRPAIIYINGKYSGILNIRERSNEDNIYTNYNGLEDIDMIENWEELKEGTMDNYYAFKAFYKQQGHTLEEYREWMDCDEFINLMVMNLYYNNVDFPGNNIVMWRPQAEGGKWRWVAKDADYCMGLYGQCNYKFKILEWLHNPNYDSGLNWGANSYDATRLFRRLMEDEDFKRLFIDRACIYMGDFLNEKGTRKVWDAMYDKISFEYPYHRALINKGWPNYSDELNSARSWVKNRTNEFYSQLGDFYNLGSPLTLTINKEKVEMEEIIVNGIKLSEGTLNGKFFPTHKLTISGKAPEGKEVKGWKVTGGINEEYTGSEFTMQMPKTYVHIAPVIGESTGIDDISIDEKTSDNKEIYDLTGRKVNTPQKGQIYIQKGQKAIWR